MIDFSIFWTLILLGYHFNLAFAYQRDFPFCIAQERNEKL